MNQQPLHHQSDTEHRDKLSPPIQSGVPTVWCCVYTARIPSGARETPDLKTSVNLMIVSL